MSLKRPLLAFVCGALLALAPLGYAQTEAAPGTPPPAEPAPAAARPIDNDFEQLFQKIGKKIETGAQTEADFTAELAEYDALLAKYGDKTSEEMAMLAIMKARLYLEILQDNAKGIAILKQVKANYPSTDVAGKIDQIVGQLEAQAAADSALAVGKTFAPFSDTDTAGAAFSLADYKGKIVLIDFWATWCGPCVKELPNVIDAYKKYHDKGFEIVGISLDDDRAALDAFTKEHATTWKQFFDGQGWKNKLARQYGINSIPATFLLDGEGRIVAKNLRGDALDKKLAELLK